MVSNEFWTCRDQAHEASIQSVGLCWLKDTVIVCNQRHSVQNCTIDHSLGVFPSSASSRYTTGTCTPSYELIFFPRNHLSRNAIIQRYETIEEKIG